MKKGVLLVVLFLVVATNTAYAVSGTSPNAMPDAAYQMVADYGLGAMTWSLALMAAAAAWLLVKLNLSATWKALLVEVGAHARDVVLEVWQTYVEALKASRVDGKLTDEEKAMAKELAIAKIRARLSLPKLLALGGGVLVRVFNHASWAVKLEELLGGAVETAVGEAKRQGKAAGLKTSGTEVAAVSVAEAVAVPR